MRSGDLFIERIRSKDGGDEGVRLTHIPTDKKAECGIHEDYKQNATVALKELVTRVRLKE